MQGDDRLKGWIGAGAIALAVALPLLALLPFGWLWLWQHGLTLYWLGGALVASLVAFALRAWLLTRVRAHLRDAPDAAAAGTDAAAPAPRERAARDTVERLARDVDPARITSREDLTALAIETIEAVARDMHPEVEDPIWNFTVPEALTLIERVAQRLRPLVVDAVPLGDRLTVGQALAIYRWRGVIDVGTRAYELWRIVRLLNPVSAVTQEIRERLSRAMYEGVREEVAKRLAAAYVREVGGAAIDLYSGRLRVLDRARPGDTLDAAPGDLADALPLGFLVAGRVGAGKSSLVNALAGEVRAVADVLPQTADFAAYEVQREGLAPVRLIDSPGIAAADDVDRIAERAAECDVVLWVVAADRPDRDLDSRTLARLRAWFAARPERRPPPVLVVASHVDRLRPFQEWQPPYDIAEPDSPKARNIRAALDAAAEDLEVPSADIVPVCLAPDRGLYNVDLVWARLVELLPAAKSTQLLRRVDNAKARIDWRQLLRQAAGAGRLAVDVIVKRSAGGG